MADETVSTAVKMYPGCSTRKLALSATIAAGEVVKVVSSEAAQAQAVAATALTEIEGLLVLGGGSGNDGVVVKSGPVDPGFTVTPGATYYVSTNAGKITKALADISGAGAAILGYGISANKLEVDVKSLGVVG